MRKEKEREQSIRMRLSKEKGKGEMNKEQQTERRIESPRENIFGGGKERQSFFQVAFGVNKKIVGGTLFLICF